MLLHAGCLLGGDEHPKVLGWESNIPFRGLGILGAGVHRHMESRDPSLLMLNLSDMSRYSSPSVSSGADRFLGVADLALVGDWRDWELASVAPSSGSMAKTRKARCAFATGGIRIMLLTPAVDIRACKRQLNWHSGEAGTPTYTRPSWSLV